MLQLIGTLIIADDTSGTGYNLIQLMCLVNCACFDGHFCGGIIMKMGQHLLKFTVAYTWRMHLPSPSGIFYQIDYSLIQFVFETHVILLFRFLQIIQ